MTYLLSFLILISYSIIFNHHAVNDKIVGHFEGVVSDVGANHKMFVGNGTLSIMGNVSFQVDYFISYETKYNGTVKEGGINSIKSAEGDELYIKAVSGTWYVDFIPNPPEVKFEVQGEFIGGTGKYKNASGKTIGTGTQLYIPGTPTVFDWTGTISY